MLRPWGEKGWDPLFSRKQPKESMTAPKKGKKREREILSWEKDIAA